MTPSKKRIHAGYQSDASAPKGVGIGRDFTAERFKREEKARSRSLEISLADTETQLNELTGLRLRNLVTDAEFVAQRQGLQQERLRLRGKMAEINAGADTIEPFGEVISFSNRAAAWFSRGDDQSKRLILETVGSNLSLTARMLNVEAKKPFASLAKSKSIPHQLGVVDDVRTNNTKHDMLMRIAHEVGQLLDNEDGKQILANIRTLRERFEPEVVAMEQAKKSRWAKVA